jgi:hypothetical protein
MIPNCSSIASNVRTIQQILRATGILADHTTNSQTSRAPTGTTQKSEATKASGRLREKDSLPTNSSNRKKRVGLKNANPQTPRVRQGEEIEAVFILRESEHFRV